MKNLILIILTFLLWTNSSAQIALQDSSYVAKVPGNSLVGLYHSMNGTLEFKNGLGVSRVRINPNLFTQINNGYFIVASTMPDINSSDFGVVAVTNGDNLNYGTLSYAPVDTIGSVAGLFIGDVSLMGALYFPSDKSLKKDIRPLENSLSKIMKLNPTQYEYLEKYDWAKGKQTGLIAQELKEIFPHLVTKKVMPLQNEKGEPTGGQQEFEAINYVGLISILTKGIQEQQVLIDEQESRLLQLEEQMELLLASRQKTDNEPFPTNNNHQGIILEQNFPNPFGSTTTINCQVPHTMKNAYLVVQNIEGKRIREFKIQAGIEHLIEVNLQNISKGMYLYSIINDGKILETKKMQVGF